MSDVEDTSAVASEIVPQEAPRSKPVSEKKLATLAKARAKKAEVVRKARVEKREAMLNDMSEDYRAEVSHLVAERMAVEKERLEKEFANWKLNFYESRGQSAPASVADPKPKRSKPKPAAKKKKHVVSEDDDNDSVASDETYVLPMKKASRSQPPPSHQRRNAIAPQPLMPERKFPTLLGH